MEKGAKTTWDFSRDPLSFPYFLVDLMEGLVAFGVPLFWGVFLGVSLGNQDPGSTKKEKDDKKGSKKKLGQPETFQETNDDFLGLRES